ncbi:thyroid receptor-interacting protein 11 isoform X2 [Anabrus simplex]|uniref:thyroid receptor-interacting protein 11 isoform X2 n=1 Tax=Anabrus simplex TaxID=316456 RepID=UPI0035A32687
MAWFGEGLSTLKEQLQNFTKEVLSEEKDDSDSEENVRAKFEEKSAYEDAFRKQQEEISALREQNAELRRLYMGTPVDQKIHSSEHESWHRDVEHTFDSDDIISRRGPANVPNGAPNTSQEQGVLNQKVQLESLHSQLAQLQTEKNQVLLSCEVMQRQNNSLTLQNEELQKKYLEISKMYESVKISTEDIEKDLEEKKQLESLQSQLAEVQKQNLEIQKTCRNFEEQNKHLAAQNEDVHKRYQDLTEMHEAMKAMISEKEHAEKSNLESLQCQLAEVENRRLQMQKSCENLEEQNKHLTQQNEEIIHRYQEQTRMYESLKLTVDEKELNEKRVLDSLQDQLAELEQENLKIVDSCERLEERNKDLTQQNEEILKKYEELSKMHESPKPFNEKDEKPSLESPQGQLTESKQEELQAISTLEQRNMDLVQQNEDILAKYQILTKMYDSLKLTMEEKELNEKKLTESLQTELCALTNEKLQVTSNCNNLEERNVHLTQQNEEIQLQYQKLLQKYESLKLMMDERNRDEMSELESLKSQLAELCKEKVEAFGACKVLEEQVAGLILQKDDLVNKYHEQSKIYEALKKEVEERGHNERTKLESLQGQLAELHREKLEATRACNQLEEQIAALTLQNEEINRTYEKQSEMYRSLTEMMEVPNETLRLSEEKNVNLKSQLDLLQCQLTQLQKEKVEETENCRRLKDQIKVMKDEYNEEINKLQKDLKTSNTSEENLKGHVMELEAQLLDAQEKFLESLNKNEKSEHEMNIRRLERENNKTLSEIVGILKNLEDREVQEIIYGHISALEMENQVLKLRNAQLEKGGSVNRTSIEGNTDGRDEMTLINKFVDAGTNTNHENFGMVPNFLEPSAQKQALEDQVSQLQVQIDLMKRGTENREAELREECARLAKDLKISTEKIQELESQLQERHSKEHERLRDHLLSIEEYYTNEALRSEALVKDLQSKLAQAEELLKHSSTAYTSASIRTNQQVEALEKQLKLTLVQKEEIQQKLQASEDKINQQAVALQNLQTVLEQFQRGKDLEVAEELRKVHNVLNMERQKQEQQLKEIAVLKEQLLEARGGLTAASRLHEVLDEKTKRISGLQEEVSKLNTKLASCEDKLKTANVKLEGLIEKNLIKNLLIGYFMAPNAHRPKALHVVATVLNFSHEEREKIGLDGTGSGGGGWLNKLLYPGGPADTSNTQSLSEAFVRFLEKESMPQPNLRLLPDRQETADKPGSPAPSRSSSTLGSRRSSVHTADYLLPTFMPEADASTSILKSILKDS